MWIRFVVAYAEGNGKGHVQSLILGAVLFIAAVVLWALGVIGDLLAAQRVMTQKTFERVRRIELQLGVEPSHYEANLDPCPGRRARARRTGERRRPEPPRRRVESMSAGVTVSEDGIVTGNTYDKYGSTNPLCQAHDGRLRAHAGRTARGRRARLAAGRGLRRGGARAQVGAALWRPRAWSGSTCRSTRSRPAGRERQAPNLEYKVMQAENLPFAESEFDLASAIEVLEHVPDPEHTLAEMARCAAAHLLVSVPREPLWRMLNMARGAYWSDLGNTPGHLNHWSKRSFMRMLSRYGKVVEARSPFPWTMLLVRL